MTFDPTDDVQDANESVDDPTQTSPEKLDDTSAASTMEAALEQVVDAEDASGDDTGHDTDNHANDLAVAADDAAVDAVDLTDAAPTLVEEAPPTDTPAIDDDLQSADTAPGTVNNGDVDDESGADAQPTEAASDSTADDVVEESELGASELGDTEAGDTGDDVAVGPENGMVDAAASISDVAEPAPVDFSDDPEPPNVDGVGVSDSSAVAAKVPGAFVDDGSVDDPLLQEAPERSFRRMHPGRSVVQELSVSLVAAALLPAAIGTAAVGYWAATTSPVAPVVATTTAPQKVDLPKVAPVVDEVKALEAELVRLQSVERAQQAAQLERKLRGELKDLSHHIALARDARREGGQKGKALSKPFTADELGEAAKALSVTSTSGRFLVDRAGTVVLPKDGSLNTTWAAASPGSGVAGAHHVDDGALFAKACAPKEKVCIVERQSATTTAMTTATSVAALSALEQAARRAQRPALPAAEVVAPDPQTPWVLVAGMWLLSLLLAALGLKRVQAKVAQPWTELTARLEAVSHGHAQHPPADAPAEMHNAHLAVDRLQAFVDDKAVRDAALQSSQHQHHQLADALRGLREGALHIRLPLDAEGADLDVTTAFNGLAEHLQAQAARLQSHLQVLQADGAASQHEEALRRLEAIKPLAALLADIAARLVRMADHDVTRHDLLRLSSAISQRGQAAEQLVAALERTLRSPSATDGATAEGTQQALARLVDDLEQLTTSHTLPVLLQALSGMGDDEVQERLEAWQKHKVEAA